jgi:hypothetical protein
MGAGKHPTLYITDSAKDRIRTVVLATDCKLVKATNTWAAGLILPVPHQPTPLHMDLLLSGSIGSLAAAKHKVTISESIINHEARSIAVIKLEARYAAPS